MSQTINEFINTLGKVKLSTLADESNQQDGEVCYEDEHGGEVKTGRRISYGPEAKQEFTIINTTAAGHRTSISPALFNPNDYNYRLKVVLNKETEQRQVIEATNNVTQFKLRHNDLRSTVNGEKAEPRLLEFNDEAYTCRAVDVSDMSTTPSIIKKGQVMLIASTAETFQGRINSNLTTQHAYYKCVLARKRKIYYYWKSEANVAWRCIEKA